MTKQNNVSNVSNSITANVDLAVVIVHGYQGGHFEVNPLKKYLTNKGIAAYSVLLKGHGGASTSANEYGHRDWLSSAATALKHIQKKHKNIVLVGFSMGGLICTQLALRFNILQLILVNTPVYVWDFKIMLKNTIEDIKTNCRTHINYYLQACLNANMKGMWHFWLLREKTKPLFARVQTQTLILQCLDDATVRHKSANFIAKRMGENAQLHYLKQGGHLIFLSNTQKNGLRSHFSVYPKFEYPRLLRRWVSNLAYSGSASAHCSVGQQPQVSVRLRFYISRQPLKTFIC